MRTNVSVLIVEDSESDAALVIRQLQKARYSIEYERVDTPTQMQAALDRRPWDIIISDYKLPSFSAPAALALLQQTAKDIPFIVVSGTIGEESAVEVMREGAQDYLMKDKLTRLASAVEREVTAAKVRSDRRAAEASIRDMLEWQEALFEGSRDAVFVSDEKSHFVAVNKAASDLTGYSKEELLTMRIPDLHDQNDLAAYELFHDKILGGEEILSESRIRRKDGRGIDTEFNNKRVLIGGTLYMHTTARDVSERKRAELSLRQQATAMNTTSDGMGILDSDGRYIYVNEAHARVYGFKGPEELIGQTWEVLYDEPELRRFHDIIMPAFWESGRWQGEAVGCRRDKTTFPQELSLTRLQGGGLVCVVRDITDRKRAEEALRLQSAALESAANAIVITNHEGMIEWVNPAFTSLTGYTAEGSIGRNPRDLVKSGRQDPAYYADLWRTILAGKTWRGELINRRKDGSFYTEEQTITPLRNDDGELTHFIAIKQDITERKRVEDALALSEKKFKWLFDYAPVAYHVLTPEGAISDVNVSWCETLGYAREEVLGRSIFDFILESERSLAKASFAAKKKNVTAIRIKNERRFVGKDGSVKTFLVGDFMTLDSGGQIVSVQTTMEDITDRKRAAEELRESEEKYRSIFENVQDVYYESGLEGTILEVSPSVQVLTRGIFRREDLIGKSMYNFYSDPEQRRALLSAIQTRGRVTDFEIMLRNGDGSLVPCSISAMIRTDEGGRPLKIMGSLRDITERKRAEHDLRLSEERFRSVWDNSAEGMRLVDREGRIVAANEAYCRLVDIPHDKLVGGLFSVVYAEGGPDSDPRSAFAVTAPT